MEKRATVISLIFVGVIVLSAVGLIIFMGITARDYNYVQLEINPRIEFIVDKNFKVVSYAPLNDDGLILLAGENLKGMDIDDACARVLDLSARLGYIDVDGVDNAINLTVIDGLTQALDTHICEGIYGYLKDSEIISAVTENAEDRKMLEEKKKEGLCCSNKYKLISSIMELDKNQNMDDLKKLSEIKLINMVTNIHQTKHFKVTTDDLKAKQDRIDEYEQKYIEHLSKITDKSKSEFSTLLEKFQMSSSSKFKINFEKEYSKWQKDKTI